MLLSVTKTKNLSNKTFVNMNCFLPVMHESNNFWLAHKIILFRNKYQNNSQGVDESLFLDSASIKAELILPARTFGGGFNTSGVLPFELSIQSQPSSSTTNINHRFCHHPRPLTIMIHHHPSSPIITHRDPSIPVIICLHPSSSFIFRRHSVALTSTHDHWWPLTITDDHPTLLTTHHQLHHISKQASTLTSLLEFQMTIHSYKCWAGWFAFALPSVVSITASKIYKHIQSNLNYCGFSKEYIRTAHSPTCGEQVADWRRLQQAPSILHLTRKLILYLLYRTCFLHLVLYNQPSNSPTKLVYCN